MSTDDWRVKVSFTEPHHRGLLREHLEAHAVEEEVRAHLGGHVVVSDDGDVLFLYAGSRGAALAAEHLVRDEMAAHGWQGTTELTHWHEVAEDWEPASADAPETPAEDAAERARLMQREDAETRAQGYSDWEVRVQFADRGAAHTLSERLDAEGIPHVRRFRYVLVGAMDEDAARAWADRLRREAPEALDVTVEGTFATVAAHNPWRFVEELGGGP